MTNKDVLEKDEIDALLGDNDNEQENSESAKSGDPLFFDFSNQTDIVKNRLPSLDLINKRFIRDFQISLYDLIRKAPEVSIVGSDVIKYCEYIESLPTPTSLNIIKMEPLRGPLLFTFEYQLIFAIVETFFGGDGKSKLQQDPKEFTQSECRIINKIIEIIFKDMQNAWESILSVKFKKENSEQNPMMAKAMAPNEVVVISKFKIELESGEGEFHLVMPFSSLEPYKPVLDSGIKNKSQTPDQKFSSSIRDALNEVDVSLRCVLAKKNIKLNDVSKFKTGEVIPIEIEDNPQVLVNGIPLYKSKFGVHEGRYSVKIVSKINKGIIRG